MSVNPRVSVAVLAAVIGLAAASAPVSALAQGKKKGADRILSNKERDQLVKAAQVKAQADAPIDVPAAQWITVASDRLLVIDTNKGRIVAELAPDLAPASVERVQILARRHFYDGLRFFRVVPNFMDQTGDPKNTGEGGSELPDLKGEFTFRRKGTSAFVQVAEPEGLSSGFAGVMPVYSQASELMAMTKDGSVSAWGAYCPGVLGMARETTPDSANSQFFLMRDAYPSLESKYAAFGRVVVGLDVVRAIKTGEPVADPQDMMTRVRLASDLPAGEAPVVIRRQDPQGSAFQTMITRAREKGGADFSICDLSPQVKQG